VQMGEDRSRVHTVGSTGIDRILTLEPMERAAFFASVGLAPRKKNAVITFHPETLSDDSTAQAQAMLEALHDFPDLGLIFTGSNADPGAREIDAAIMAFVADHEGAVFHPSLGSQRYLSALHHCDVVLGNSSSGILEAPSFKLPTVNIGGRQARRLRAASVIDVGPPSRAIVSAICQGLLLDCSNVKNPFGDGKAAGRIMSVLAGLDPTENLVRKSFRDILT